MSAFTKCSVFGNECSNCKNIPNELGSYCKECGMLICSHHYSDKTIPCGGCHKKEVENLQLYLKLKDTSFKLKYAEGQIDGLKATNKMLMNFIKRNAEKEEETLKVFDALDRPVQELISRPMHVNVNF